LELLQLGLKSNEEEEDRLRFTNVNDCSHDVNDRSHLPKYTSLTRYSHKKFSLGKK